MKNYFELSESQIKFAKEVMTLPPYFKTLGFISEKPAEATSYVNVSFDKYGRLSIDGKPQAIMNSMTSNHGKLLAFFEHNKSRLIEMPELKELFHQSNYDQPLKDIKRDLKRLGYKMSYFKQYKGGYVYSGIIAK